MADDQTSGCCDTNSCCGVSLLGRAFSVSISIPVLILATAALALIPVGWQLGGKLFVDADSTTLNEVVENKSSLDYGIPDPNEQSPPNEAILLAPWEGIKREFSPQRGTLSGVYKELVDPATKFFERHEDFKGPALWTLGGLWTLLVYAFFGGAISRIAVVQLGRGERVSLTDAVRYSFGKLQSYFMAPLFVIVAVVLMGLLIAVPSLLLNLGGIGTAVVAIFWFIAIILATAMAVMLVVLAFGWPLMWGVISAEETGDVFEATSRSFSYTIQRPLKYACYVVVALVIGGLGWWLVQLVTSLVVQLAIWSASWFWTADNIKQIQDLTGNVATTDSILLTFSASVIGFLNGLVLFLLAAYTFSYFWVGYAGIYLLLRKDADQTELDEVFMPSEDAQFELPQLHEPGDTDEAADSGEADEAADSGEADEADDSGEADEADDSGEADEDAADE